MVTRAGRTGAVYHTPSDQPAAQPPGLLATWRRDAIRRIGETVQMSASTIAGTCLCGAVSFRVTGEVAGFQYCHCSRCRKFTGSAHAANLFVRPADLEWQSGEDGVGTFLLDGDPKFPTAFCQTCGSSMPSMSSTGRYWIIPAGSLDADPGVRPSQSIFWGSRAPWFESTSDLPRHDELPGAST